MVIGYPCTLLWTSSFFYRGDDFRQEYSKLGEMRSILSANVHIMALTATATKTLRAKVFKVLGMKCPVVVTVNPDEANIKYEVVTFISMSRRFGVLADQLRDDPVAIGCAIIFCQCLEDYPKIYRFFSKLLLVQASPIHLVVRIRVRTELWKCFTVVQKHALRIKSSKLFRLNHLHFQ